ncbi:MAG: DUF6287 domain-containing protein [Streptococcaceae bacterium]|jgi:hypothetical protein|nr:DUF6287 domain-containing protein [Streptococcaceae bacterium]
MSGNDNWIDPFETEEERLSDKEDAGKESESQKWLIILLSTTAVLIVAAIGTFSVLMMNRPEGQKEVAAKSSQQFSSSSEVSVNQQSSSSSEFSAATSQSEASSSVSLQTSRLTDFQRGDYSSLAGRWRNQAGERLVISANGNFVNRDGSAWQLSNPRANGSQIILDLSPNPGYGGNTDTSFGVMFMLGGVPDDLGDKDQSRDRMIGFSQTADRVDLREPIDENTYYLE